MWRWTTIFVALTLAACHAKPKPAPVVPPPEARISYDEARKRLSGFLDRGFVVSHGGGSDIHQGDALIFTGLALYSLDCATGALSLTGPLQNMIGELNGGLYRHPDIKDQISMDGALGLYLGIAKRVTVCGDGEQWRHFIQIHKAFVDLNGGRLNPTADTKMPLDFGYLLDKLAGDGPSATQQAQLEAEIVYWAEAVAHAHAACYRVHLGLTAFQIIEQLGGTVSQAARDNYCAVTKDLQLPTVDHWCGRGGLKEYLDAFRYDTWQYRHQRCPAWEGPDGAGDSHPAVDYLKGWADYYGTPK